jgi:hypothetical protein
MFRIDLQCRPEERDGFGDVLVHLKRVHRRELFRPTILAPVPGKCANPVETREREPLKIVH